MFNLSTTGQRDLADGKIKCGQFFLNDPPTGIVNGGATCWICRIDESGYEDTIIEVYAPHDDRANEAKAKLLGEAVVASLNAATTSGAS